MISSIPGPFWSRILALVRPWWLGVLAGTVPVRIYKNGQEKDRVSDDHTLSNLVQVLHDRRNVIRLAPINVMGQLNLAICKSQCLPQIPAFFAISDVCVDRKSFQR